MDAEKSEGFSFIKRIKISLKMGINSINANKFKRK